MMPKMDGVEATKLIREMGYAKPIVALTANALTGQSEMFLSSGFDAFLSKPIDIRELNAVLNRFVRDKQPKEVIEKSAKQRIADNDLAAAVMRDIVSALEIIEDYSDLQLFTTTVHGIKSALNNAKETELAKVARKLEEAGLNGDTDVISSELPAFIRALRSLTDKYKPAHKETDVNAEPSDNDSDFLRSGLQAVITACESFNITGATDALNKLKQKNRSGEINGYLEKMTVSLLRGELKSVVHEAQRAIDRS
jgi:CheY-like chemotaxis protein